MPADVGPRASDDARAPGDDDAGLDAGSALDGADDGGATPSCSAPAHTAACDDDFCVIPAGCFLMGSPAGEACRNDGELQHEVTLTRDYLLSRRELSRGEVEVALGYDPYRVLPDHPATEMTWHQVAALANALSERDGFASCFDCRGMGHTTQCTVAAAYAASIYECPGYRPPTEAEWEYAYRAGTTTMFYNGTLTATCAQDPRADQIAWYGPNALKSIHSPGGRTPNAWGLTDMAGNVFEWTADKAADYPLGPVVDPYTPITGADDEMSIRSGSWEVDATFVRAASRVAFPASFGLFSVGVRLARTLPAATPRPNGVTDGGVGDGSVPAACSPSEVAAPVQIPMGPRVHLQVDFEGRRQLVLVDTGSPHSNFYLPPDAPSYVPGIGLVTIGCEQVAFGARNVRSGQTVGGLPVLGTVGNDWLLARPTRLDVRSEGLTRWATAAEVPDRNTLVRLPYALVGEGWMVVDARIDGTAVKLMLDTGTPLTLWIGPVGAPTDREIVLVGQDGARWTVRQGVGSVELAGEQAFMEDIWRTPSAGVLETFLRSLGPDVVGILGLASFRNRALYFGLEEGAVFIGPL